jgi:hypothetical protein
MPWPTLENSPVRAGRNAIPAPVSLPPQACGPAGLRSGSPVKTAGDLAAGGSWGVTATQCRPGTHEGLAWAVALRLPPRQNQAERDFAVAAAANDAAVAANEAAAVIFGPGYRCNCQNAPGG